MPPAVTAMLRRWPTVDAFAGAYSPANLFGWALRIRDRCLLSTISPTMGMLSMGYGPDAAGGWLAEQLISVNGLFNLPVDRQLQAPQCIVAASVWVSAYPRLKASEVWVFLADWMGGLYGKKLFGAVDLTEMGDDLGLHLRRRYRAEDERDRSLERERRKRELFAPTSAQDADRELDTH